MNNRIVKGDTLEIYDENNVKVLSISEKIENGMMLISVDGEINSGVAHDFEDEVMAALSVCNNIKIDFSTVTFVCSYAMQALLSIQRIIDDISEATLILTGITTGPLNDTFEQAGFYEILCIEEN